MGRNAPDWYDTGMNPCRLWVLGLVGTLGVVACSANNTSTSDGGRGGSPSGGGQSGSFGGNGGTSASGGFAGTRASGGYSGGGGAAGTGEKAGTGGEAGAGPEGTGGAAGNRGTAGSAGTAGFGGASGGSGGSAGATGIGGTPGCGTLANTAAPVAPTALTSVQTDYTGGAVTDGTYDLVAVEQTDPIIPGEEYQRTLLIESDATAFQWAINDVNVNGSGTFDLAGSLALSGTLFGFSGPCAASDNYRYTATGNQLVIYFVPTATTEKIYHFQMSP
jgi:hypothetical protein